MMFDGQIGALVAVEVIQLLDSAVFFELRAKSNGVAARAVEDIQCVTGVPRPPGKGSVFKRREGTKEWASQKKSKIKELLICKSAKLLLAVFLGYPVELTGLQIESDD
jgi:hypothetical protein